MTDTPEVSEVTNPRIGKQPKVKYPKAPQVQLNVTTELIETAIIRDSSHCMIAEAVRAIIPAATSIAVDVQTIRFSLPELGLRYTYLTPRSAQIGIVEFDQGIKPDPFHCTLRGGHVTAMTSHKKSLDAPRSREVTPAQRLALKRANAMRYKKLKTTTLVPEDGGPGNVMRRVGGKPPPTMGSFARRRSFGLRALER